MDWPYRSYENSLCRVDFWAGHDLLYFAVHSSDLLLVVRFLHGLSFGVAGTATGTIVANLVPIERCGEGIGYYGLSITISSAIGPFLGMFLSQHGSYNMIFTVCTMVAAVNIIMGLLLSYREPELTGAQREEMKGFKLSNFFEFKVIPVSIVCAVIFFCYSSVISFLSVYAKEIHLVETASFFFIVFAVVIFFSRPFVGRMFDVKGENPIMYAAILLLAIGMTAFSQAHNGAMLLLAGAVMSLGFGAIQSSGQAITVKLTETHRMGLANSTYFMCADIGMGSGAWVFGFIIPFSGYRGMYLVAAAILAVTILLYYFLHGKKAARDTV